MKQPPMVTWIAWLGATLVAAVTYTAFAYTNFETKDSARESKSDIVQRLDRIENKLDELRSRN
jgi:hypothetical protein